MPLEKEHILVVEDDAQMRSLLEDFLIVRGYVVSSYPSGARVLKALEPPAKGCDAIVADMVMPGMDGLELLKRVKAIHPDIPLLLITAFPNEQAAVEAANNGAAAFFMKPFKLDLLGSAIEREIERRQRQNGKTEEAR